MADRGSRPVLTVARVLYAGGGGFLTAGWYAALATGVVHPGWRSFGILVGLIAVTVTVRVLLRPRGPRNSERSPDSGLFNEEAKSFLSSDEVGRKRHERERLYVYIRLLTVTGHLSRVSEFIDLSTDLVSREIGSTWTLPRSATQLGDRGIWFPVMTPLKGALVDRLHVRDDGGAAVPILAVREAQSISIAAWFLIVERLAVSAPSTLTDAQIQDLEEVGAMWIVRRLGQDVAKDPELLEKTRAQARSELTGVLSKHGVPPASPIAKVALRFLSVLSVRFVVTGFVRSPTEHLVVAHSYRMDSRALMVSGRRDRHWYRFAPNYVKGYIGRTSHVFRLDLATVHQARSFHLELLVPRGNYFAMAALTDQQGKPALLPAETSYAVEPWYYRISHLGHRYLHFYSRNLGGNRRANELTFRVLEVPWLSLLLAVSFATISTVCIGIVAFMTDVNDDRAIGIAQVVVALPITATLAWLSIRPPSKMIARQALGFTLTVASLVVLILAAAALFGTAAHWPWPGDLETAATVLFYFELGMVGVATTSLAVRVIAWVIDYGGVPRRRRSAVEEEVHSGVTA